MGGRFNLGPFTVMTNIFVTEFAEFSEVSQTFRANSNSPVVLFFVNFDFLYILVGKYM